MFNKPYLIKVSGVYVNGPLLGQKSIIQFPASTRPPINSAANIKTKHGMFYGRVIETKEFK